MEMNRIKSVTAPLQHLKLEGIQLWPQGLTGHAMRTSILNNLCHAEQQYLGERRAQSNAGLVVTHVV